MITEPTVRGFVTLEKLHLPSGQRELLDLGQNIIVRGCRTAVCHLIAGDAAANYYCDRMQFGVGTMAETVTDTTLQSPITPIKAIADFDYPGEPGWPHAYRCRFTSYLLSGEANGFPISECGLLAVNGNLLARKTFTPQDKTSDFIFTVRWTLQSG